MSDFVFMGYRKKPGEEGSKIDRRVVLPYRAGVLPVKIPGPCRMKSAKRLCVEALRRERFVIMGAQPMKTVLAAALFATCFRLQSAALAAEHSLKTLFAADNTRLILYSIGRHSPGRIL